MVKEGRSAYVPVTTTPEIFTALKQVSKDEDVTKSTYIHQLLENDEKIKKELKKQRKQK